MKTTSTSLALALGAFMTFGSAAQIQGIISGFAPGDVDVKGNIGGAKSNAELHSDFMWSVGAEFLVFPVGPLMAGGGLGFISVQQDGNDNVVMPALPLWGSVGVIGPEKWSVRPYLEARIGYPIPISRFLTWWNRPSNFYVAGNIGAQLPYHMGVEFNCVYMTMNKYFKTQDADFRMNSLKFGGSITVHFDLFKNSAESDKEPVKNNDDFVASANEGYADDSSASEVNEAPESEPSYTGYDDAPTDQPVEEPVNEEPVAEPVAEAPSEETPSEEIPPEDQPAEEMADATPEENTPVAEAPAEEAIAEPEKAPEPEPAVKKKASSKKKASKKSSKKTTKKKPAKKTSKKTASKRK